MTSADVLVDAFGRIRHAVHEAVRDLAPDQLEARLDADANSIAWLVWHLTRIQDDHVAGVARREQVWTSGGWVSRFDLPFDPPETGYGHGSQHVAAVRAEARDLLEYHDEVHAQTTRYVEQLTDRDLDRVVDDSWDPPVTLGVRLVSVISDDLEHVGQAAFIRGVLVRR